MRCDSDGRVPDVAAVAAMTAVMAPRGPDGAGVWSQGRVVAAALRIPPEILGTGEHTVRDLIAAQSRRRAAATGGESTIPLDDITEDTVRDAGWALDDVLPEGTRLRVRRTANLHQGATIHDVTAQVNPELCRVAVAAAEAIGVPVTGIDLLVRDVTGDQYAFIEANERPGWPTTSRSRRPPPSSTSSFRVSRGNRRRGLRKSREPNPSCRSAVRQEPVRSGRHDRSVRDPPRQRLCGGWPFARRPREISRCGWGDRCVAELRHQYGSGAMR